METIMNIRTQILNGNLELPSADMFQEQFGHDAEPTKRMFKAAWHNYLLNKGSISLTYWAEQFSSPVNFNAILKVLADNKWFETHSIPARNWAEASMCEDKLLTYVSADKLAKVRAELKYAKYLPEKLESSVFNLTKQNGKTRYTGLIRYGFRASASTEFNYDVDMLNKYKDSIILNTNKGMQKVRERFPEMNSDSASYDAVSTAIVEHLAESNGTYSMGNNFSDSRGRSIKEGLSKVANPIGYKDFRAMLVIPEEFRVLATSKGAANIYLFVAELLGFKGGTLVDKEMYGLKAYEEREYLDLDLSIEKERADLFENIWLERLYDELEMFYSTTEHYWSTPIELDASASMLSHMGLLLGDKRLLAMTNTLHTEGEVLNDPWFVESLRREQVKGVYMKKLYGSSQADHELLQNDNIAYTSDDLKVLAEQKRSGGFGIADDFKEFIIRWAKPSEAMRVNVYEDTFEVECNRFKNVGEYTLRYDIYDSVDNKIKRVAHTKTKRVPDLDQFRRWFVTGLIHSQDSQVLDFVMEKVMDKYSWGVDIHDAIIVSPEAANDVRNWYAEELQVIYDNRSTILERYFQSIGIRKEAMADWNAIMNKVQPVTEPFKASKWALK